MMQIYFPWFIYDEMYKFKPMRVEYTEARSLLDPWIDMLLVSLYTALLYYPTLW